MRRHLRTLLPAHALVSLLLCNGCVLERAVVHMVGNSLAESGEVFTSDDDPELIKDAIPFGLKTYESLLARSPRHRGLLLAAASGFTQFSYAFVQDEADRADEDHVALARQLRSRARRLYIRGRNYALRGIEAKHRGFTERLRTNPEAALAVTKREDAAFLYWAGAAWAAALSADKGDLDLIADLPTAAALVDRSLELDESFGAGVAHEFFISYEGGRPAAMGGSIEKARQHYRRALELSGGQRASVHLALAESVSVRQQDLAEFGKLVEAALAVDPDRTPDQRLANLIAHRRARWLLSRVPDLFLEADLRENRP